MPSGGLGGFQSVVNLYRRVPFTMSVIALVLGVSAAAGLLGHPIDAGQLARWGFGRDDLSAGRLWRLASAFPLIRKPYMAITISGTLLCFVAVCELVMRTRRTALVFVTAHVVGYIGTVTVLTLLGRLGWSSAAALGTERDVGASNGAFGAAGAALVFLPAGARPLGFLALAAYLLGALAVEQRIWDVQHLIAFGTGLAVGALLLQRDPGRLSGLWPGRDVFERQRPFLMSWFVGGMGVLNILGAAVLPRHAGFERLEKLLPFGLPDAPRMLLLFSGLLLLVVSGALRRRQRAAWWAALCLLLVTLGLQIHLGITKLEAGLALVFLLVLVAWKEEFPGRSQPPSPRSVVFTALGTGLLVPLVSWTVVLAMRHQFVQFDGPGAAAVDVLRRIVYLRPLGLWPAGSQGDWLLEAIPLVFWGGTLLVALQSVRAARAPQAAVSERVLARNLVLEYGRTGTAYLAAGEGNSLYFGKAERAFLGYRVHGGVALALGDPTGPPRERADALADFGRFCREHGWVPAILAATPAEREACRACGYALLQVGEEAVLPLGHVEFKGKTWQNVRTALNRARHQGIDFRLYEGGRVPGHIEAQLIEIDREWVVRQELPRLEFTQGRVEDVRDPAVEVAVAVGAGEHVHGYVDWLPIPARRGWVVDLMRRRPEAMHGTMEFLIGMSLLAFQERGDRFLSLAAAPLADIDRGDEENVVLRLLGLVFERFQTFYDFRSLFDFKDRFRPSWEPVYLAYRDGSELPAIALAILRSHLPHLGWAQATRLLGDGLVRKLRPQDGGKGPAPRPEAPGEQEA